MITKSEVVKSIALSAPLSIAEASKAIEAFNQCVADDPALLGCRRRNKSDRKRNRANRWR